MRVLTGTVDVSDVDAFLDRLAVLRSKYDTRIQAIDARYVAGRAHLEQAVGLTRRAIADERTVADDHSMELLLYVAGTRQIDSALQIGIGAGTQPVVIVIDGGNEAAAGDALRTVVEPGDALGNPDCERLCEWFDITDRERAVTDASVGSLVLERVALRALEA